MTAFDMRAGSMFLLEEFHPKNMPARPSGGISNVTAMALSLEKEKCRKDEERRTKQISYGYATKEYQYYIKTVQKKDRKKGEPHTPDKNGANTVSRRRWDGKIKLWRRALHKWYDTHAHPSTAGDSSSSSASGLRSETGFSEKNPLSVGEVASPIDYAAMLEELSLEDKPDNQPNRSSRAMAIPVVGSSNGPSSATDFQSSELYAAVYYQMMLQQNLILGWLFQNSNNPQFPAVCELLQQFFTQQAVILNCLTENYGS